MTSARLFRKWFAFSLAILLTAATFTACGKKDDGTEDKDTKKTEAVGLEDLRKGKAAYEIGKYDEAAMSFSLAAQDGNAEAQFLLGKCYQDGTGVEQDFGKAAQWFKKAADQDHTEAQFLLGKCYQDGTGIERDIEKAEKWLEKAADRGHAEAKDLWASINKDFSATCCLIRQRISDSRSDILPPGYVNVPKSNVEKLFTSRAVLEETVKRLSLPYTYEQLYNNISVTSDKNGDYIVVTASSKDPVMAATLANTLAEVFIDEYKKLIRRNLKDLNDSNVKTRNTLERELAEKNGALNRFYAENNISDIDNDIAYNTQQLLSVEDQLRRASASLESAKQALYALQGELANTPEEVVTHREKSSVAEDRLRHEESLLKAYEQLYARSNPILIQQREVVKKLQADLEKAKKEDENDETGIEKVVVSRNPAYTQITMNIATKNAEIAALNNEISLNNKVVIELRERRELLTKSQTEVRQLKADIDQTKKQIATIKAHTATIQNFLDRSYSDISIQELAKVPSR